MQHVYCKKSINGTLVVPLSARFCCWGMVDPAASTIVKLLLRDTEGLLQLVYDLILIVFPHAIFCVTPSFHFSCWPPSAWIPARVCYTPSHSELEPCSLDADDQRR